MYALQSLTEVSSVSSLPAHTRVCPVNPLASLRSLVLFTVQFFISKGSLVDKVVATARIIHVWATMIYLAVTRSSEPVSPIRQSTANLNILMTLERVVSPLGLLKDFRTHRC